MTARARSSMRRLSPVQWLIAAAALLALAGVSVLGWQWYASVSVDEIAVRGIEHAREDEIISLAAVDSSVAMFELDSPLIAERIGQHPWVRRADVTRRPTGTLHLRIEERRPVALALDASGRLAYFLDQEGYRMPLAPTAVYDVPLLSGISEPYDPILPVRSSSLRELLAALADVDPDTDALVSHLERSASDDYVLHTAPAGAHGSIPVRLGRDAFSEKLRRLRAYWEQAVLTRPDHRIRQIDLRFEGQVVTREE
jgi:cell division protein FtsQ